MNTTQRIMKLLRDGIPSLLFKATKRWVVGLVSFSCGAESVASAASNMIIENYVQTSWAELQSMTANFTFSYAGQTSGILLDEQISSQAPTGWTQVGYAQLWTPWVAVGDGVNAGSCGWAWHTTEIALFDQDGDSSTTDDQVSISHSVVQPYYPLGSGGNTCGGSSGQSSPNPNSCPSEIQSPSDNIGQPSGGSGDTGCGTCAANTNGATVTVSGIEILDQSYLYLLTNQASAGGVTLGTDTSVSGDTLGTGSTTIPSRTVFNPNSLSTLGGMTMASLHPNYNVSLPLGTGLLGESLGNLEINLAPETGESVSIASTTRALSRALGLLDLVISTEAVDGQLVQQIITPQAVFVLANRAEGGMMAKAYVRSSLPPLLEDGTASIPESAQPVTDLTFEDATRTLSSGNTQQGTLAHGTYLGSSYECFFASDVQQGIGYTSTSIENGLRTDIEETLMPDSSDLDGLLRVQQVTVWKGDGTSTSPYWTQIDSKTREYKTLCDGTDVMTVETQMTANGEPQITYYTYDEDSTIGGLMLNPSFKKVKSVVKPDGSWTRYEYDLRGRLWRTYRPWLDSPASPELATAANCVVEETLYEANATGVAAEIEWGTVSTVQGIEVARTFKSMSYSADTAVETTTTIHKTNAAGNQVITYGVETKKIYSINVAGKRTLIATSDGSGTTFYLHDNGTWNESTRTFAPSATGRDQRSRTISRCDGINAVAGNTRINTTVTNAAGSLLMSKSEIAKTSQPWASASYALEDGKLYAYDSLFRLIRVRTFSEQTLETIGYTEGYRTVTSSEGVSTVEQLNLNVQSSASARLQIPISSDRPYELYTLIRATSTASAGLGLQSVVSVMIWHAPSIYAWNKNVRELSTQVSDLTGRLWSSTDELGRTTTYSYANQGRTVQASGPEGVTVSAYYRDSRPYFRSRGEMQEYIHYVITPEGLIEETVYQGTDLGPRWTRRTTDWTGSVLAESSPSADGSSTPTESRYFHDGAGRVVRVERPGMAPHLTVFDAVGNIWRSGLDVDGGGLSPASSDVLTENITTVSTDADGREWIRRESRRFVLPGSSEVQTSFTSNLLAAAPATRTLTETFDKVLIDETMEPSVGDVGMHKKRVVKFSDSAPGSPPSIEETWSVDGMVYKVVGPNGQQSFGYNSEGRMTRRTSADGTTEWNYNHKGQLNGEKDANGLWTYHSYDENTWRPNMVTYADGAKTLFNYDSAGRVVEKSGTASEHIAYEYEPDGQIKLMKTWRSEDSPPDITRWHYSPATGRLVSKEDASHRHTFYTYDAAGRLASRTDARQVTTTWHYDVIGNMVSTTYSDQTPSVTVSYDRLGRQLTVSDGSGSRSVTYAGQSLNLAQCQYSADTPGLLPGVRVARSEVAAGGFGVMKQALEISGVGWAAPMRNLGYDSPNLLSSVTTSTLEATFHGSPGRWPGVSYSRPRGIEFARLSPGFTNGHTTSVTLTSGGWSSWTILDTFDSSLDLRGRRKQSQWGAAGSVAGIKTWKYGYDLRGQVTSAELVGQPGGKWGYRYDGIGNRIEATVGALQPPPDQWTTAYTTNELNQYANISHPSPMERVVLGLANPQAQVTVKLSTGPESPPSANFSTFRFPNQGSSSFVSGPQLDNSSGPMWRFATVEALRSGAATNGQDLKMRTGGWLFFPPANETLLYDANGNLIEDGRWLYHWDAENRLVQMEEKGYSTETNRSPPLRLSFDYDSASRRIRKMVESYRPGTTAAPLGSWGLVSDTRFVYEGWNLMAELDMNPQSSSLTLKRSYVWGRDVSGTEQGAGGVGGLLWVETAQGQFLPHYDTNGNILAYYRLESGSQWGFPTATLKKVSERSYDAFGRNLTATLASGITEEIPFGFSSKYTDKETDLVYYGFRYYSAELGRWLNRDPLRETGGVNLLNFVQNAPTYKIDALGLRSVEIETLYNFADGILTDEAKKEFERIFSQCFSKCKCKHSIKYSWKKTNKKCEDVEVGTSGGNIIGWYPTKVTLCAEQSDDQKPVGFSDQNFRAWINTNKLIKDRNLALGIVLAHELGLHGIAHSNDWFLGDTLISWDGHTEGIHEGGFVDSPSPKVVQGLQFTKPTCEKICEKLDLK